MHEVATITPETDEALAERALRGERAAESALAQRLYPGVHALASRLLRDPENARDATQEAFLRAFSRLEQFDRRHRFSAWLFRILVNLIRDEFRRSGRVPGPEPSGPEPVSAGPAPGDRLIREEDLGRLRSALDELPEETRLAILLYFQEGLNGREVAYALDLSHQAARLRICRGIAIVRARLVEER